MHDAARRALPLSRQIEVATEAKTRNQPPAALSSSSSSSLATLPNARLGTPHFTFVPSCLLCTHISGIWIWLVVYHTTPNMQLIRSQWDWLVSDEAKATLNRQTWVSAMPNWLECCNGFGAKFVRPSSHPSCLSAGCSIARCSPVCLCAIVLDRSICSVYSLNWYHDRATD